MVQRKRGKKGFSKGNEGFQKGGVRTYQPEKGAVNDFNPHTGRGKDHKGKGKEGAYTQSALSASETPSEEGYGYAWESDDWFCSLPDDSSCSTTAWMASVPLNLASHPTHVVPDLSCTRSVGSRAAIKRFRKHVLYYGITTDLPLQ